MIIMRALFRPFCLFFLDQIGIEIVGSGEKEKTGQNQKINGGGRVCQEIGTELSSQLQPNTAVNSKGKHSRVSHANACVLDACTPKWCVRLVCAFALISELHCKCYFVLFFIISA